MISRRGVIELCRTRHSSATESDEIQLSFAARFKIECHFWCEVELRLKNCWSFVVSWAHSRDALVGLCRRMGHWAGRYSSERAGWHRGEAGSSRDERRASFIIRVRTAVQRGRRIAHAALLYTSRTHQPVTMRAGVALTALFLLLALHHQVSSLQTPLAPRVHHVR